MDKLNTAEKIRASFGETDALRDMGLMTPPDVIRLDDVHYGDDENQVLDVYMPKVHKGRLPVIVSVHGGGWVYGNKERYQFYCMNMAERGFAVINFTYRLMPEYPFPSALEDTQLVMEWLSKNVSFLNLDARAIFMMGDSAGAHYLSLYLSGLYDATAHQKFPFIRRVLDIKAAALHCGMYQPSASEETVQLLKDHLGDYTMSDLDVAQYVSSDFPNLYVMSCSDDFLKGQLNVLTQALIAKKAAFTLKFYASKQEELLHCFFLDIRHPHAHQANHDTAAFFKSFIL